MLMKVDWLLEKETWLTEPPAGKRWVSLWVPSPEERREYDNRRRGLHEAQIDAWYIAHNEAAKKRHEEEVKKRRKQRIERKRALADRKMREMLGLPDSDAAA